MRNGLIRPLPNWQQPATAPATPPRGGLRIPRPLLVILVLYVFAFLTPLRTILNTPRGWLAVLLAYLVLRELGAHFSNDGGRGGFRALAEYAAVGMLVFALVTAASPTPPQKAKAPAARRKPPATQTQSDPWGDLREQAEAWWQQLGDSAPTIQFPDAKGGR